MLGHINVRAKFSRHLLDKGFKRLKLTRVCNKVKYSDRNDFTSKILLLCCCSAEDPRIFHGHGFGYDMGPPFPGEYGYIEPESSFIQYSGTFVFPFKLLQLCKQ